MPDVPIPFDGLDPASQDAAQQVQAHAGGMRDLAGGALDTAGDVVSDVAEGALDGVGDGISSVGSSVIDAVGEALGGILGAIFD